MKISNNSVAVTLAVTVICALASSSHGTILFEEGFNYTPGTGLGANTNPGNSTQWNGSNSGLTIGSSSLSYPGLVTMPGNDLIIQNSSSGTSVNYFTPQSGDQVFMSFLVQVNTIDGANDYFVALNNSQNNGAPSGGGDVIDTYSYKNGNFEMRANADAATGGATPVTAGLNTTYFIVEEVDLANKDAYLWVDPSSLTFSAPGGNDTPPTAIAQLTGLTAGETVSDVGFKAQSTTGAFTVGSLIVGTTWGDVTGELDDFPPPPIGPEPTTFVLCGLGMVCLVLARRMRR